MSFGTGLLIQERTAVGSRRNHSCRMWSVSAPSRSVRRWDAKRPISIRPPHPFAEVDALSSGVFHFHEPGAFRTRRAVEYDIDVIHWGYLSLLFGVTGQFEPPLRITRSTITLYRTLDLSHPPSQQTRQPSIRSPNLAGFLRLRKRVSTFSSSGCRRAGTADSDGNAGTICSPLSVVPSWLIQSYSVRRGSWPRYLRNPAIFICTL